MRNSITNVGRPARAIVLDPPNMHLDNSALLCPVNPKLFPSFTFSDESQPMNTHVAYLSTPLAFNIGLHVTWLESLIASEESAQKPDMKDNLEMTSLKGKSEIANLLSIEISPLYVSLGLKHPAGMIGSEQNPPGLIRYATHVRVAHIKHPVIENLSKHEKYMAFLKKDRQGRIDAALQSYFKVDRVLAKGDILAIRVQPYKDLVTAEDGDDGDENDLVFFKVPLWTSPPVPCSLQIIAS